MMTGRKKEDSQDTMKRAAIRRASDLLMRLSVNREIGHRISSFIFISFFLLSSLSLLGIFIPCAIFHSGMFFFFVLFGD